MATQEAASHAPEKTFHVGLIEGIPTAEQWSEKPQREVSLVFNLSGWMAKASLCQFSKAVAWEWGGKGNLKRHARCILSTWPMWWSIVTHCWFNLINSDVRRISCLLGTYTSSSVKFFKSFVHFFSWNFISLIFLILYINSGYTVTVPCSLNFCLSLIMLKIFFHVQKL